MVVRDDAHSHQVLVDSLLLIFCVACWQGFMSLCMDLVDPCLRLVSIYLHWMQLASYQGGMSVFSLDGGPLS